MEPELKTLDDLKIYLKRRGAKYGPFDCMWANEGAINILEKKFKFVTLIFEKRRKTNPAHFWRLNNREAEIDARYIIIEFSAKYSCILY